MKRSRLRKGAPKKKISRMRSEKIYNYFGVRDSITVVRKHRSALSEKIYPTEVSWAIYGDRSIKTAKEFAKNLQKAIKFAEKVDKMPPLQEK